jgi:hypothetical protein
MFISSSVNQYFQQYSFHNHGSDVLSITHSDSLLVPPEKGGDLF